MTQVRLPPFPLVAIPHPAATDKSNSKYCSVLKNVSIVPGTIQDYHYLARFHYRRSTLGPGAGIWVIRNRNAARYDCDGPVAVIVYTYPVPNVAVRNAVTKNFFARPDKAEGLSLLNRHVRCISRVIVDPRWRGLGLAGWLVRETKPILQTAMIESMALMGQFHPFLEKAGLRRFNPPQNPAAEKLAAALEILGVERKCWYDPRAVQAKIDSLSPPAAEFLEQHIQRFLGNFGTRRDFSPGVCRTAFLLEKLAFRWAYFVWLNPDKPVEGLHVIKSPVH